MQYNQLPEPVSAAEAIRDSDTHIRVPDGAEVVIGPFERQYANAFRIARIGTFKDLQTLGFVSSNLSEEQITRAYRNDERAFRDAIVSVSPSYLPVAAAPSCGCGEKRVAPARPSRRHFQNHLVELLQSSITQTLSPSHPAVVHAYRHVKSWLSLGPHVVGIYALSDIVIGDHATLTNTPTVKALYARDITIGKEGRLRFLGGSVKVRCRNLNGPSSSIVQTFIPGLTLEFARRAS